MLKICLAHDYQGMRLAEQVSTTDGKPEHAVERLQYRYNALGQVTQEWRWIAKVDSTASNDDAKLVKVSAPAKPPADVTASPAGLSFVTRHTYDEAGRLVEQILPDGHKLTYRYTPAQTSKHTGKPGQLEAMLFDGQVVVADIEQTQTNKNEKRG